MSCYISQGSEKNVSLQPILEGILKQDVGWGVVCSQCFCKSGVKPLKKKKVYSASLADWVTMGTIVNPTSLTRQRVLPGVPTERWGRVLDSYASSIFMSAMRAWLLFHTASSHLPSHPPIDISSISIVCFQCISNW